jgi:prophage regulatory protein
MLQKPKLTQFIRLPEVLKLTQMSRATIWRWARDGQFPKPTHLGPASIAWRESEYEAWAEDPEEWHKRLK